MKEEQQVQRIKRQLLALGQMLPGSLSEQWNICGSPGCKCKTRKSQFATARITNSVSALRGRVPLSLFDRKMFQRRGEEFSATSGSRNWSWL